MISTFSVFYYHVTSLFMDGFVKETNSDNGPPIYVCCTPFIRLGYNLCLKYSIEVDNLENPTTLR